MTVTTRVKTGGRAKGTPNKSTASVKAALTQAFEDMGGVDSLVEWGQENQTEFYKLWSKLLPSQLSQPETLEPIEKIVIEVADSSVALSH